VACDDVMVSAPDRLSSVTRGGWAGVVIVQHQTIILADVAGFTDPARTMFHQRVVREGLRNVLRDAFSEVGVDLSTCTVEDRGDAKLILMSPEVDNGRLADQLPSRLIAGLRRHNASHSAETAIKLRVALHTGEVFQEEDGLVGPAVNHTFRIVEAPQAKSILKSSSCLLALIASDDFYHGVIVNDPAADPDSYQQIRFTVHESSFQAWLRVPNRAAPPIEDPPEVHHVLDLFSAEELQRLAKWLITITLPQLRALVHRAAGPSMPPAGMFDNAWEAFRYLQEFNAGPDGFPPALMFVELVARHVARDVGTHLLRWNDDQARRFRLEPQLRERRASLASPVPDTSLLHLMIAVEPDGIDPHLYLVSHWRQDDAAVWPPARGETRLVAFENLEQCVDDLVVSAETAWSGHSGPVALEFVLPRALLSLPVHHWHKEHDSGDPRPLCLEYPIVVRSLERMRSPHWHRAWHQRWQTLMNDPATAGVHFAQPEDTGEPHRIDAILSDLNLVAMVLTGAPPPQPKPGADELTAALRSGLPALVWHVGVSSELLREVVTRLVEGDGLGDLPGRTQASRQAAFQASVVPRRIVPLNQPPD
jgi:hypothetical protein